METMLSSVATPTTHLPTMTLDATAQWQKYLQSLSPQDLDRLLTHARAMAAQTAPWLALPGPQTLARESEADITFYGGAAGGGKTDLLLGTCLDHQRSIIFRREFVQLAGIIERGKSIYNRLCRFNGKGFWAFKWKKKKRRIELGSCKDLGDEDKYQGQPHDLKAFDEITKFAESQFRTLIAWNRSEDPTQRCRVIATGNPPMYPEEEWVVQYWAPWLDPSHPNPAKPGELRWFAMVQGVDMEMPDKQKFIIRLHENKKDYDIVYDFDAALHKPEDIITPKSRTFIPASVTDNPYYRDSGYIATLQALPEPLRSKMLYGDFTAGREENPWQVIPSEWVRLAQARWKAKVSTGWKPTTPLSALGIDVARGGKDKTVYTPRWDNFFGEQEKKPGTETPNGRIVRDDAISTLLLSGGTSATKINIDILAVGSSPYDYIYEAHGDQTMAMNGAEGTEARDKSGQLGFINCRAQWYWQFREALDPESGQDICLPPSRTLFVDLCTPRWKLTARGIQIESKDDIIKRIKRSPDEGDSCIYAHAQKYYEGWAIVEVMRQQVEEKQRLERESKERK